VVLSLPQQEVQLMWLALLLVQVQMLTKVPLDLLLHLTLLVAAAAVVAVMLVVLTQAV